ncbi:hypothetical protein [Bradyrhizobium sp. CCBAU 65884]|uniref:hypothetical protein n=1 Tax=Bradyrhizobium sp. CCBAU 65884 TaxID=722477 RepID=UPI0023051D39|nr:hypothetical protein [Bradyrhizobium sp. CCBAU 65884]
MPNNPQFIHLLSCGEKPGRGQPFHATIRGVIDEAMRVNDNAPHIAFPREPVRLFGIDPLDVADQACKLLSVGKDRSGRRLRKSCVGLIAGVATYPIPKCDMGGFASDSDVYSLWEQKTLDFLKKEHGPALRSALRHEDETHFHIHFYTVPSLADSGRLDFRHAHPGRYARADAVDRKVSSGAQDAAYTNAMVAYADRFHAEVGLFFGHDRVGPRRRRVDRDRHKANRSATEHVERARAELELDYRVDLSESEADERSLRVSKLAFIAVAVEHERKLRAEIGRLKAEKKRLEAEIQYLRQQNGEDQVSEIFASEDFPEPSKHLRAIDSLAFLAELDTQPGETLGAEDSHEVRSLLP